MKKTLLFVAALALSRVATAQDMYLEYKISGPATATNRMYTSAAGLRIETDMTLPQGGTIKTVTLMAASKPDAALMLDEQTKTYTEASTKPTPGTAAPRYEVKVLGNERVGSYDCVHTTVSVNGKPAMEMWTSKAIPGYQNLMKLAKASNALGSESVYRQLESKGATGVMVKMTTGGTQGLITQLVKAEKRSNPASLFRIPAGYSKNTFDPAKMQNMTPAQRQKMMREMTKQYGGKPQKP